MAIRKSLPEFSAVYEAGAQHLTDVGASKFSVCEIAEALNVTTDMLTPVFDDLYSFAASFGRFIDAAVVKDISASDSESEEPARDRMFEVLMSRFDALEPFKDAAKELGKAARRDPKLAGVIAMRLPQSMALMLSMAKVRAKGLRAPLQVAGLVGLWLQVARTWLKDDSEDLSKTMAALDKALGDADSLARKIF